MDLSWLAGRLEEARSFEEIFRLVKRVVEERLGARRAGLMLVLGEIPNHVLALHQVGSNSIVMNKEILEFINKLQRPPREINAYIFVVLLHEYLHALGYLNEREVRWLVKAITREYLGTGHPAHLIAAEPLDRVFPEITKLGQGRMGAGFELVRDFDLDNLTYIG